MLRTHRPARRLSLLLAAALALAACGGGGGGTTATEPSVTTPPVVTDATPEPAAPRCGVEAANGFDDVDCTEPHQAEFAGLAAAPAGADDAAAVDACLPIVEAFIGQRLTKFVIDVGHVAGATATDDIECWAKAPLPDLLIDSIASAGLEGALGDVVIISDLDPGTCFTGISDDYFGLGRVAECSTLKAEMILGVVDSAATGDFPGRDAVLDEFDGLCAALLEDADFELMSDTTSFIYGNEEEWNVYERRYAICTVYRPEDFQSPEDEEEDAAFVGPESYVPGVDAPICLQNIGEGDASEWLQVDCSEPHTSELAAVAELPEGALPDDYDEAVRLLRELCAPLVQAYTRYDFGASGMFVDTRVTGSLGAPVESPVDCIASVAGPALVGTFQEADLDQLLGDVKVLTSLSPGICFQFAADANSLATEADCAEPGALLFVGTYQMAEYDPYPEIDVLRAERSVECARVLAESGLSGDPATLSGTFISQANYELFGTRIATCDISPA
jgi:hypothetical protein